MGRSISQYQIPKIPFDTTNSWCFYWDENSCKTLYDRIFDHLHKYPAKSVLQTIFHSNQQPPETTASRGIFSDLFFVLCGSIFEHGRRFVYRFQSFFLCPDIRFDLRYHYRKLFLTFFSRLGIYVMTFPFAISIFGAVSALV